MNFWHKISDFGITETFSLHQIRNAQLTNRLVFFGSTLTIPFLFYYASLSTYIPLLLALFFIGFNASLSYFSKRQKHETVAILFVLNLSIFMLGLSLCVTNSSFQYFLIPGAMVTFAVVRSNFWGYLMFSICVISFFLASTSDYYFEPLVVLPESTEVALFLMNLIAVFVASWYFLMQIKVTNNYFEKSLEHQKKQIENQHEQIEQSFTEIRQSIDYAKRIQHAILPPKEKIEEVLDEYYIFYKPKDVVAGDFYYLEEVDSVQYIAVADCTGHGVPGAMVSVVCNQALNRAIREFDLSETGAILDKTRELVEAELNKSNEEVSDGMDIVFCALNGNQLMYSGANNPLWIFRNQELITLKADKQPVGKYEFSRAFSTQSIELQKGDFIVMSTDGFADQFGGEKGKKLKTKNFLNKLLSMSSLPAKQQRKELEVFLDNWKQGYEQIDDICVLGFRH